ncbi:hypothetical protein [Desulfobacca acetoxidans]
MSKVSLFHKILIILVIIIISQILSSPVIAEQLVAPSGKIIVFKSEDLMDYGIKHINEKKSLTDPTFLSTIAALVDSGTRCSVIKSGSGLLSYRRQVRILEGRFNGTIGWVPGEFIK